MIVVYSIYSQLPLQLLRKKIAGNFNIASDEIWHMNRNTFTLSFKDTIPISPSHYFTPIAQRCSQAFILADFYPYLYNDHFSYSLIAHILKGLGENGQLYMEYNIAANDFINHLKTNLSTVSFNSLNRNWIELKIKGNINNNINQLKTIHNYLYHSWQDLLDLEDTLHPRQVYEQRFITQYTGAQNKSYLLEHLIDQYQLPRPVKAIDYGSGFGFLSAELAMKGHNVNLVDFVPKRMNTIGPWIARKCQIEDKLTFSTDRVENNAQYKGPYDLYIFSGVLYELDRGLLPEILMNAMNSLSDKGILYIYEYTQSSGSKGNVDKDIRFTFDELHNYLKTYAGKPSYFNYKLEKLSDEQASKDAVNVVVQK